MPGGGLAIYEWCLTDRYDAANAEHRRIKKAIETGDGLPFPLGEKGDDALLSALAAPLHASKLAKAFVEAARPEEQDLILVTGIGSAYPLLRTHNLLNNLHSLMGRTPLVLFYPGIYDGQSLRLFGSLKDNPYYRAFRLVD